MAKGLVSAHALDGMVVAVYGQWGTGKSSFLSFVRHYAGVYGGDSLKFMEFNPWWFSNAEELGMNFFAELNAVIGPKGKAASSALKKIWAYASPLANLGGAAAKYFVPGGGVVADLVEKGVEKIAPDFADKWTRDISFAQAKKELSDALKGTERTLVFIDDIDRLSAQEVHQLFRLIKSVANLPNTIYILAFDRNVVATALSNESGVDGEAFLEKIVQVAFELPPPEKDSIDNMLWLKILELIKNSPSHLARHSDIASMYQSGGRAFVTKPRDVVRLTNTLGVTYAAVEGEVNAADFICLEILRLFHPESYRLIRERSEMFLAQHSTPSMQMSIRDFHQEWLSRQVNASALTGVLTYLFPQLRPFIGKTGNSFSGVAPHSDASVNRRLLRISSAEILPTYFRLEVSRGGISHGHLRQLIAASEDVQPILAELDQAIAGTTPSAQSQLANLINRVLDFDPLPTLFSQNVLHALLVRGNRIMALGARYPWSMTIGAYRSAIKRIIPQIEQLHPLLEAAKTAGQISALALLVWILDEAQKKGEKDLSALIAERSWLVNNIVQWLDGAERSALFELPALGSVLTLWANETDWSRVRAKMDSIVIDPDSWTGLFLALEVPARLKDIPFFGLAADLSELYRELFGSERAIESLRILAEQDPPYIPGSEVAANLMQVVSKLSHVAVEVDPGDA